MLVDGVPVSHRREFANTVASEMDRLTDPQGWRFTSESIEENTWSFQLIIANPDRAAMTPAQYRASIATQAVGTLLSAATWHPQIVVKSSPTFWQQLAYYQGGHLNKVPRLALVWRPDMR